MRDNQLNKIEYDIKDKIFTIRGLQVILDADLAELYEVETKQLNRAVKRNMERFPDNFMFQLNDSEFESLRFQFGTLNNKNTLRSQNATLEKARGKHRKYLPYVFTEQGVAMLSGVLRSKIAIRVSIQIMEAFVSMRKFISENAQIFHRLDFVERKQFEQDQKFQIIFDKLQDKIPEKGIFFDGQVFDAYKFASDIIRTAKSSLILIDNYIDDSVLTLLNKRKKDVKVKILTKNITKELILDLNKHNKQYPKIEIKEFKESHDRFLIIDNKEIYHIGASLKDLGKKWFAFTKFDKSSELLFKNRKIFKTY